MKTYQSGTKDKKKNFFKRHWHAIAVFVSGIAVVTAVAVSVIFALPQKSDPVGGDLLPPDSTAASSEPKMICPTLNATVGLGYADKRLVYWDTLELWRTHPAVDFVGTSDVVAVCDGVVTNVEMHTVLDGNVVTVTHEDGYVSVYKSLGDDVMVKTGDKVKAGDKLGTTSDSMMSELNTGAHLHLELKKNGGYIDPSDILPIGSNK